MSKNKTFIRITNENIFQEIQDIKNTITELCKSNSKEHNEILLHQQETNGRVKLNKWIATTALAITTTLVITLITLSFIH